VDLSNRIPILASDRGALRENFGDAGFLFTISERCTQSSNEIPGAQDFALDRAD
jgi:hypothetical protein